MVLGLFLASLAFAQTREPPECSEAQLAQERQRPRSECRGPTGPEPFLPTRIQVPAPEVPERIENPPPNWPRAPLPEGCLNTSVGEGVPFLNMRSASRCAGEMRFATMQWPARRREIQLQDGSVCVSTRSRAMELTWEDVIWIGRMLEGEAEAEAGIAESSPPSSLERKLAEQHMGALIWTIAKRQVNERGRRDLPSLAAYIQDFSQPVNPDYLRAGRLGCDQRPHQCTDQLLERRRRIRSLGWEQMRESVRRVALRFALGVLPDPYPEATNFSAYSSCPAEELPIRLSDSDLQSSRLDGRRQTYFCKMGRGSAPEIGFEPPPWLNCAPFDAMSRAERELQDNLVAPRMTCPPRQ
jgi:hypothetical protein